ncbi:MAG: flagellar biosynthetic protein FliO [Zymomonas mobilis]|uniref:Flagellar protein n=1 Tax=Zymomonas mobilis TaxID=542 RepID=A0A542W0L5_ZYMMB|nr:flagellar biosynthetic protein FliO [Zymomonas mobilis]TQL17106.1 flagellar protein FliO/FliZ [Zymomonas mobilis]
MIGGYLLRMMIPLIIITGLIILTLWLLKKFNLLPALQSEFSQKGRTIKLIETLRLGRRQQLVVVEFSNKKLLLAVTDTTVSCLSETDSSPAFSLPDLPEIGDK